MKKAIKRKIKLLGKGRLRDTTKCIFCNATNVTKEHIFSKRFHQFMDSPQASPAQGIFTSLGEVSEQVIFKFPGALRDWQIKCVCGGLKNTCNNGWMRELDAKMEAAASRLMRLPSQEILPFRLLEDAQKTIATWAVMKVMVVNHNMVHHTHRKQIRAKQHPPSGWAVWIGNYERNPEGNTEWSSRPFSVIRDDLLAARASKIAKANSHTTTIILQNLLIHVAYCRDHRLVTKWRFSSNIEGGPLSGHLFRIWPTLGHSILWPGKPLNSRDADVIADAIMHGVIRAAIRIGLIKSIGIPVDYSAAK